MLKRPASLKLAPAPLDAREPSPAELAALPGRFFEPPRFMMVEASSTCNFLCPLCLWPQNKHHGRLAVETFAIFIAQARTFLKRACFSGRGEPTLNPAIYDILRACVDAGVTADLATNGSSLLDDVDQILDSGVHNVNVSIDADNAADYVRYRVNGDFERLVAGMRLLADTKRRGGAKTPTLQTCTVIFRHNEESIDRMKAFFADLGFERFLFKSAHLGHGQLERPLEELEQEWRPRGSLRRESGGETECSFLTRAQMLWNGDITRCATDQNALIIGNVAEQPFEQIWRGERSRRVVARVASHRFAPCTTCEYSNRAIAETATERWVI